jgi:hypothetical protein
MGKITCFFCVFSLKKGDLNITIVPYFLVGGHRVLFDRKTAR